MPQFQSAGTGDYPPISVGRSLRSLSETIFVHPSRSQWRQWGRALLILGWVLLISLGNPEQALAAQTLAHPLESRGAIAQENARSGTSDWQLTQPAPQHEIEGYASLTSVNQGQEIELFVNTQAPTYQIDIFRMGWYGGEGGRQVAGPIERQRVSQPRPRVNWWTREVECNWRSPYTLTIPDGTGDDPVWLSGFYLAKLTASTGEQSYIIFVVREDDRPSDYLFQSSVTTYQAYNNWGGRSLYTWNSRWPRAYKVSFNRPYALSPNPEAAYGVGAGEFLTNMQPSSRYGAGWEYNLVRWLEREGYDVTYATNIDTHHTADVLLNHRAFLIVGHDEYWSWEMRQQVTAARDAGVGIGVFSANTCYWQIRLEPSSINGASDRTIVAYKEWARHDPLWYDHNPTNDQLVTTRWRDEPVYLPEGLLFGVMYTVDPVRGDVQLAETVPDWVLHESGLQLGDRLPGLLGYEVDKIRTIHHPNLTLIAHSPHLRHDRVEYSDMTYYESDSGALVVATGTMQWVWGLDNFGAPQLRPAVQHPGVQQITRNLLSRLVAAKSR